MPKAPRSPALLARPRFTSRVVCWRVRCRWRCFGRCWIRCMGGRPERREAGGRGRLRSEPCDRLQRQEDIVQGMRPRGDPEAAQYVEPAEEETGDGPESERAQ